jgi:hypothetical protein
MFSVAKFDENVAFFNTVPVALKKIIIYLDPDPHSS